jgi:hypothetical protein
MKTFKEEFIDQSIKKKYLWEFQPRGASDKMYGRNRRNHRTKASALQRHLFRNSDTCTWPTEKEG